MKINKINKTNPSIAVWKNETHVPNRKILLSLLTLVLSVASIGVTQGTLGRFSQSFTLTDSAQVVEFDIEITPPEEFWLEQGGHVFEYHFLSGADIRGLVFQVTNHGETGVLCKPYISGDLTHCIYVAEEVRTEFVVEADEAVEFWLILSPDGLDTHIRDIELWVDIQQLEGR